MKVKTQRFYILLTSIVCLGIGTGFVLVSFRDNISFFYAPSDLAQKQPPTTQRFRLGGMVMKDSVVRNGLQLSFRVTDFKADIQVTYEGIAPDLFREGQGVVAEGTLVEPGLFKAETLLAKHDENYMPPELASLQKDKP